MIENLFVDRRPHLASPVVVLASLSQTCSTRTNCTLSFAAASCGYLISGAGNAKAARNARSGSITCTKMTQGSLSFSVNSCWCPDQSLVVAPHASPCRLLQIRLGVVLLVLMDE